MRRLKPILIACLLAWAAPAGAVDFSQVTDPIGDHLTRPFRVKPAGLVIRHFDGTLLHEQYWGGMDRHTVLPIASATKWLSGIAIGSLADDGLLAFDTRVDSVLPEFVGHPAASTTVAQMFSHTSGAPGGSGWESANNITLEEAVAGIAANESWLAEPGEQFVYGGVSMHVAGRLAEVVDGRPWEELFAGRVTEPLGVSDTDFQGLGPTTNPRIAGGTRSSIDSYERVLRMLVDGGVYAGERVLSQEAVAAVLSDQTGTAVLESAPPAVEDYLGYGVGTWVLRRDGDGDPVEFGSPGALGATPWIDFENRYYGFFLVQDLNTQIDPLTDAVRAFAREALSLTGDYNLDGAVDADDLALWRSEYGATGFSRADGNRDGRVDAADYGLWRDAALGVAVLVPEPSAGSLLILTCVATGSLARSSRRVARFPRSASLASRDASLGRSTRGSRV